MKPECKKFHMETLSTFNQMMFESLIYDHNIQSESLKEIEFLDKTRLPMENMRGYFAKKDKLKFWIDEELIKKLPLRLEGEKEELKYKEDLVFRYLAPKPFNISPSDCFNIRSFVDDFLPFSHSNIMQWKLLKMLAIAGFVGRTYVCVASSPEFGKSSVYDVINYLTDKSPVFKPRSVPGVLNHINGIGNMVFDETHRCKKEVRDIIEEFALQIGGGKAQYLNGALKSKNTKMRYNCNLQSINFLYNTIDCYSSENDYFEYIFSNNEALDTRFLKFRFDGKLTEDFTKDFDIPREAEKNKMYYIQVAKYLLHLQDLKKKNGYERRYTTESILNLKGRRKMVYDEITWLIDLYCESQEEMNEFVKTMDNSIMAYRDMINNVDGERILTEEKIE